MAPVERSDANGRQPAVPDYRLIRVIGAGSYGRVWLARSATGTFRAIKIVHRDDSDGGRAFSRAFKGLRHYEPISRQDESLMDVLHVGPPDPQQYFYCVMELADAAPPVADSAPSDPIHPPTADTAASGRWMADHPTPVVPETYVPLTLRLILERHGRLPVADCIEIGIALSRALTALHHHGLVHRDVKPSNIIFAQGRAKLADIDLVTPPDATLPRMIAEGFTPPEGAGSPGADLYSLGKVLYEASTGLDRTDFPAPPLDLSIEESALWADLNEILLRACARFPAERYASAKAMNDDLQLLRAGKSVRRLRSLERWHRTVLRLFGVVTLAGVALIGALLRERFHARRLAALASENRDHVVRLHLAEAFRLQEDGNFPGSLPSLAAAWSHDADDPVRAAIHQLRFAIVSAQCPQIRAIGAHEGAVNGSRYSGDGQSILTASEDHTARVWDASTGNLRFPPLQHEGPVLVAGFTPDQRRILTASQVGMIVWWDAHSGDRIESISLGGVPIQCAAFSPDGTRVVTGNEKGDVIIHDLANGLGFHGPRLGGLVYVASWSPDGTWLAVGDAEGTALMCDGKTGQAIGTPIRCQGPVRALAVDPASRLLAVGSADATARVWDKQSGNPISPPLSHSGTVWTLEFSQDGEFLLSGGGRFRETGEAKLWQWATGTLVQDPIVHRMPVYRARFSPDGRHFATASVDGSCRWIAIGSNDRCAPQISHTDSVRSLEFSVDGKHLLTTSRDQTWRISELTAPLESGPFLNLTSSPRWLEVGSDRRWIAAGALSGETVIADASTLVPFARLPQEGDARDIVASADGSTLGIGNFHSFATFRLDPNFGGVQSSGVITGWVILSLSRDGQLAFAIRPGLAAGLLRASTNHFLPLPPDPQADPEPPPPWNTNTVRALNSDRDTKSLCSAFSPDTHWVAAGFGSDDPTDFAAQRTGELRVWNTNPGNLKQHRLTQSGHVVQLAFSPDSRRLITAAVDEGSGGRSARMWDVETGTAIGKGFPHVDGIISVAFNPNGHQVATGGQNGIVRLWDSVTQQPLGKAIQHARGVPRLEFSPDGRLLLTASFDRTVRLWDTATGDPVSAPMIHSTLPWKVRFTADGLGIVTASDPGEIRLRRFPAQPPTLDQAVRIAAAASGRQVTDNGTSVNIQAAEQVENLHRLRPGP